MARFWSSIAPKLSKIEILSLFHHVLRPRNICKCIQICLSQAEKHRETSPRDVKTKLLWLSVKALFKSQTLINKTNQIMKVKSESSCQRWKTRIYDTLMLGYCCLNTIISHHHWALNALYILNNCWNLQFNLN